MKSYKIFLFIAAAVGLLTLIAYLFPPEGLKVAGVSLKFPTIEKIITPKEELDLRAFLAEQEAENQRIMNSLQDSADYLRQRVDSGDMRFYFPEDNSDFFAPLFALCDSAQAEGRTIRIVHYGDSQLEMDRMSSRLRAYMQRTFGGGGPGMLPFQTVINTPAVAHSTRGDLTYCAPYGDSTVHRASGHYGPLVMSHQLHSSATTTFSASNSRYADSLVRGFSDITLLLNNGEAPLSATLTNGKTALPTKTVEREGVAALRWRLDSASRQVSLSVSGAADLYGVMLDNGPGVAVDNVPMRGCSGQQFTLIDRQQLADAYAKMDVGLIILQFGGNSVPYIKGEKSLLPYAASLGKQIDRLRSCCPSAQILFIGPSDMSTTINGEYVTYPFLPQIVATLRDSVIAHGAAFWSLYDAMGGKNSMAAWVKEGLAGSDYIHFSQKGADIMGDRLAKAFDNAYQYHKALIRIAEEQRRQEEQAENLDNKEN